MDEPCGVHFTDYDKLTKTLTPPVKPIKTGNQSTGLTLDCHAGVNEVRDLQFPIFTSRGSKRRVLCKLGILMPGRSWEAVGPSCSGGRSKIRRTKKNSPRGKSWRIPLRSSRWTFKVMPWGRIGWCFLNARSPGYDPIERIHSCVL